MNYSTTQGSNLTIIAAAVVILIAKSMHPWTLTEEDIITIIMAGGAIIAGSISYYNRFKKGDLTLGGFRRKG